MKRNAGQVYYCILNSINSCVTIEQLDNCVILLNMARIGGYAFTDHLCGAMLVKRCELIAEQYQVTE